jgi:site-specific DNA-methyltransferase (adenine-specific)
MKNQLYYGDNLDIMRKHIADESVDLCYIDPPFKSDRDYNQIYNNIGEDKAQSTAFVDTWEWTSRTEGEYREICQNDGGKFPKHVSDLIIGFNNILGRGSVMSYLVSMTLRIVEIRRVLKPTGSFYLHCDPTLSPYLRVVVDVIFNGNFLNEIAWCYGSGGASKKRFSIKHDVIFWYAKGKTHTFNVDAVREPYSSPHKSRGYKKVNDKEYLKMNELGRIPFDWWQIPILTNSSKERLGYPTQKPEALLERIIKASSNEGDLVLDAFCGCGTTVAVAQRLNRRWIGIDITYNSISLVKKRLAETYGEEVFENIEENGIPKDMESAAALAHKKDDRLRKEFEKWSILTYTDNKAMINDKKGKDRGVDGTVRVLEEKEKYKDILFSVKSGKVNSGTIRDFRGVIEREDAAAGVFITLNEPSKDMRQEAAGAGTYKNEHISVDRIKIVSIKQIMEGARLNIPLATDVVKKARKTVEDLEHLGCLWND